MCGFLGTFTNKYKGECIKEDFYALISHRGPDSNKSLQLFDDNFKINFARLSINDLGKNGDQPFEYKDIIVFANCEIYNFKSLKEILKDSYNFRSKSDAEVILYSYLKWGTDFIHKINGMFAIVIINKINGKINIYRDRLGIKPVYYYHSKDIFVFCSEFLPIVKLLKKLSISLSIDHKSINKYLYGPYIGSENTLIANIKKLSPGHFIDFNKDSSLSFSCHQYWSLVKKENHIKDKINQFEEIFSKTINEHLTADVDIYSMYSGGLDSTLLINSSKKIKDNLKTVTINYNDTFSELEKLDIRNQIESLNIDHEFIDINDINIKNDLYEIIDVFDDLSSSDGGFISNYYAAKHLNMKNIKAVILGDGSDEIFGGYSWFNLGIFPLNFLPKKLISFLYFYSKSRINFNKYSKKTYENLNNTLDNNLNIFDQISFDEITNQLSNHYLMKVDKPFMKFSIEARVPFVDHKIVEFAYSLNKSQKLKYSNAFSNLLNSDSSKHFLRKIAQKNIFNDVHKKRKKGFSISYDDFVFKNKNDIAMSLDNLKNLKLINKDLSNLLIKKLPYFEKSKYNPYFKNIEMLSWKSHLLNIWFDKHISV